MRQVNCREGIYKRINHLSYDEYRVPASGEGETFGSRRPAEGREINTWPGTDKVNLGNFIRVHDKRFLSQPRNFLPYTIYIAEESINYSYSILIYVQVFII